MKLDRAFVAGLGSDSAADAIAAAVINLSYALGLSVIGEGVENEDQLTVSRALRCDRAQGYLWGAPQAAAPLAVWIATLPSAQLALGPLDIAPLVAAEGVQAARSPTTAPIVGQARPTLAHGFADAGACRMVLDHLLANASKYSWGPAGGVVSAAADKRFVRVSVAHYGIKMTADGAARCFEPCWQAEHVAGVSGHDVGNGVGLYIAVPGGGDGQASGRPRGAGSTLTFALLRSAREAQRAGRYGASPPGMGEDSRSATSCAGSACLGGARQSRRACPAGEEPEVHAHDRCARRPDEPGARCGVYRLRDHDGRRDAAGLAHVRVPHFGAATTSAGPSPYGDHRLRVRRRRLRCFGIAAALVDRAVGAITGGGPGAHIGVLLTRLQVPGPRPGTSAAQEELEHPVGAVHGRPDVRVDAPPRRDLRPASLKALLGPDARRTVGAGSLGLRFDGYGDPHQGNRQRDHQSRSVHDASPQRPQRW